MDKEALSKIRAEAGRKGGKIGGRAKKDPATCAKNGAKGGFATAARLTPEERSESARRAALAMWNKKRQAGE